MRTCLMVVACLVFGALGLAVLIAGLIVRPARRYLRDAEQMGYDR